MGSALMMGRRMSTQVSLVEAPGIADYGLIGDCGTAALVSVHGSIDWLCLPTFSSPSVFGRLLDQDAGAFSIAPTEPFTATRRYLTDTAILETTFTTSTGVARLIDCFSIPDHSLRPLREVIRVVEGVSGTMSFLVRLEPKPDYGRLQVRPRRRGGLGWWYCWRNEVLQVQSEAALEVSGGAVQGVLTVMAGSQIRTSLCYSQGEPAALTPTGPAVSLRADAAAEFWMRWSSKIIYKGDYRAEVVRSAITLKLLTFAASGAIIAAPTTSLPETIGGGRNWDYRYCWLRDAGLTMQALVELGVMEDAAAFLEWMLHATRLTWPRLRVMYDLYGRTRLAEKELSHLTGYRGSRPVRIGNEAHKQEQADVYGEVILAACTFVEAGGQLDRMSARMLVGLGDIVARTWMEPDSGIWEIRGQKRQYTFSKLMSWTAMDRLFQLEQLGALSLGRRREKFQIARDEIASLIDRDGFNEGLRAYTLELAGHTVDASLLLMSAVGFRAAGEDRVKSTAELVRRRLTRDGLVHRYESGADDLEGDEGAFGICSFWAVQQLAASGDAALAEQTFERIVSFANDLGLFSEEIDGLSGEALGNFPQAFTHVGLINAAKALEKSRSRPLSLGATE